jgi:hypothetical protein
MGIRKIRASLNPRKHEAFRGCNHHRRLDVWKQLGDDRNCSSASTLWRVDHATMDIDRSTNINGLSIKVNVFSA